MKKLNKIILAFISLLYLIGLVATHLTQQVEANAILSGLG